MRISDWSSDVCSSDLVSLRGGKGFGILLRTRRIGFQALGLGNGETRADQRLSEIAAFHGHSRHRPTIARAVGDTDLGVGFAQNPRGLLFGSLDTLHTRPRRAEGHRGGKRSGKMYRN